MENIKMNLQRKCRKCHEFFPVEPMELKFFCDKPKCREYMDEYHFYTIKSQRYIAMNYFDIYDLDRPRSITDDGTILDYERVCRVCGAPLFNKDGKYSVHRRYCGNHSGYELWVKYNWGEVSKKFAKKIGKENIDKINKIRKERKIEEGSHIFTVCEICGDLCYIYDDYRYWGKKHGNNVDVVNIHHKIPVHKLTMENIHLIWDYSNLIALCKDCHNQQDHQLKRKVDPYIKFRKITDFIEVD